MHGELLVKIAELTVRMLCRFPYAKRLCEDFAVDGEDADMTVSVTPEEIAAERAEYPEGAFSDGYCEGICLYRAIAERLPSFDGFVFHGAAVTVGGRGVIFAAPSGTGKTTHISLLLKNYPEKVKIINGDKPIIRKVDGKWRVCSTPWAGKEGWRVNDTAPLSAIVLVERGTENSIEQVSAEDCFDGIMRQVYIPHNGEARFLTFSLVDDVASQIEFYRLRCNMQDSAAKCSFEMLNKTKNTEF